MLTETGIRCLLSLGETLNFTRTARELYMSQQAVSQHISRLEEDLGFPLFVRTRRSVSLTSAGQRMYDYWSKVAREFYDLRDQCQTRYAAHTGAVHIGYQDWMDFGPAFTDALRRMEQEHPDAVVEGMRNSPGVLLQRLEEHSLDLILIYERFVQDFSNMCWERLIHTPILLMVSPGNSKVREGCTMEDFMEEPFILDAFPNEDKTDTLRRARREIAMCGLKPSRIIVVNSRDSAYTEAELGRGVVLTTGISRIIRSSTLLCFPTAASEHVICMWHKEHVPPLVEAYTNCLRESYAQAEQ